MIITNLTANEYWFGPMRLPAGSGQTLNLDDTSDTSLYLLNDEVADAVNTLYLWLSCRSGGDSSVRKRDLDTRAAEVDHCDQGVG